MLFAGLNRRCHYPTHSFPLNATVYLQNHKRKFCIGKYSQTLGGCTSAIQVFLMLYIVKYLLVAIINSKSLFLFKYVYKTSFVHKKIQKNRQLAVKNSLAFIVNNFFSSFQNVKDSNVIRNTGVCFSIDDRCHWCGRRVFSTIC